MGISVHDTRRRRHIFCIQTAKRLKAAAFMESIVRFRLSGIALMSRPMRAHWSALEMRPSSGVTLDR